VSCLALLINKKYVRGTPLPPNPPKCIVQNFLEMRLNAFLLDMHAFYKCAVRACLRILVGYCIMLIYVLSNPFKLETCKLRRSNVNDGVRCIVSLTATPLLHLLLNVVFDLVPKEDQSCFVLGSRYATLLHLQLFNH